MANAILLEPMVPASISMFGSLPSIDLTAGAATGTLPAGSTFTRAGTGARNNSTGTLVFESANVPRFDYDPVSHALLGLLIEGAAANLIVKSQTFDTWLKLTGSQVPVVTANSTAAPDGTSTAETIALAATTGTQRSIVIDDATASVVPAGPVTVSVWLKGAAGGEQPWIEIVAGGSTFLLQQKVTLSTTWQRFSATVTNPTNQTMIVGIGYDGLGTGQTPGAAATIYAWGAQLEAQGVASSYIPTTTAVVGRNSDNLSLAFGTLLGAPNGAAIIRYTFDDGSTQDVATTIAGGMGAVPTNLNRPWIKKVELVSPVSGVPDVGVASNLLNDYAGVIAQTACAVGSTNQAKIQIDLGADTSFDTILIFGVELFPTNGNLIINYATAAQGAFTGAFSTDTSGSAYAGSAAMTTGKGVSFWSLNAPVTARYVQIVYEAGTGVTGKSVRASRVVIGKKVTLQRNFSYGGGPGVKDLGSMDFSRRGVLIRTIGKKLRILSMTFSYINRDEMQNSIRPLIERQGNTGPIAIVTDPAADADRQNRCYFGVLVGDLGAAQRNARAWEAKTNLVSFF
jgi:hypothetical protein